MATKRVIAHYMHEQELDAAMRRMSSTQATDSYVYGEVDESEIDSLRQDGLIVQVLDDTPAVQTAGIDAQPRAGMRMRSRGAGAAAPGAIGGPSIDLTRDNYYIIEMQGPLLPGWKQTLDGLGVRLLDHVPEMAYTARLSPQQATEVQSQSFVRNLRIYNEQDTAPPAPPMRSRGGGRGAIRGPMRGPMPAGGLQMPEVQRAILTYDVLLHTAEAMPDFLAWVEQQRINLAGASGRKARIYLLEGSPDFDRVRARPEVLSIDLYVPPTLHNDIARELLGLDPSTAHPNTGLTLEGEGEIVGVADTGLDDKHPDFAGRIVGVIPLGRPTSANDPNGHGTHVAGSVLGDGAASGGKLRGAAPKARLFFQSLLDAQGGLNLPLDLAELFEEARLAGARIHNNSWGAATESRYTTNSIEVDSFVTEHPDMLLVFSAGNEGQAGDRLNSAEGFTDWLSIGSPASAKNALTVGASRSARTTGGLAAMTWGQVWPQDFPSAPIGDAPVSGDPECLAAFSSRGPCDDRRIKPDLVAPGTDILSTKSSLAPLRNFWGAFPTNNQYAFLGGTSMAAPLVSGCAALVREYYRKERSHSPSAALLKATLINSTRWLNGFDSVADPPGMPNFHQGFGCLFMPWAIPTSSEPDIKLEFVDGWEDPGLQFSQTGERFRRRFSVSGGQRLRICMAYTDRPGRGTQNNLNLFVEHAQTGKKWMGNSQLPMSLNIPDPDNNVEVVRLDDAPAGDYIIQISATNLLLNAGQSQSFALVVSGAMTSALIPH